MLLGKSHMKEAAVSMTATPKFKNKAKLNKKHFLSNGVFVSLQKIMFSFGCVQYLWKSSCESQQISSNTKNMASVLVGCRDGSKTKSLHLKIKHQTKP